MDTEEIWIRIMGYLVVFLLGAGLMGLLCLSFMFGKVTALEVVLTILFGGCFLALCGIWLLTPYELKEDEE